MYECGRYSDQWVPKAIVEAVRQLPEWPQLAAKAHLDPNMSDLPHEEGAWSKWPAALNFFNWTDANGDGKMQAGEITLHPLVADHGAPVVFVDKDLTALMSVYGNLWRMRPLDINSLGAPRYDWSKAEPASLDPVGMPSAVLPDGSDLICMPDNNDVVRLVAPDGKTRWTYPSLFKGMGHRRMDNQSERVSVPGSIYGAWNMQGIVDGPSGLGPIFMLHTGTGVNHLMTMDGLYIGTLFKSIYQGSGEQSWENLPEAKPGLLLDNVTLGDECFNGSIARAGASVAGFESGHYYLLGLGRRVIAELTGLERVQRLPGGSVSLGPEVSQAARSAQLSRLAERYNQTEQDTAGSIPYASSYDGGMLAYSPAKVSLPNHANGMVLWHNERGLGIAAQLDYAQDTPLSQIFTNPSPSWERDVTYGDAIDLQVGPAAAVSGAPAWSAQHIAFIDRDGKLEAVRYRWMPASAVPAGALVLPEGREKDMAWVADLLPIEDSAIERGNAENWRAFAMVHATIPWSVLGGSYSPGMSIRADLGYAHREPGGEGVDRRNLVSETASASYDVPTLLAMRPDLWRTFVLRSQGYVLPPRVDSNARFEKGKPIFVGIDRKAALAVVQFGGATIQVSANSDALSLKWLVTNDQAPFANGGTDGTLLFKTGEACDLQIESPTLGKCRYLITSLSGQPVVIRFKYDAKDVPHERGVTYRAGAGSFFVPVVERLKIIPTVTKGKDWYTLKIDLPWSVLGIQPKHGLSIPLEFGLLRGDVTGTTTVSRTYWNSGLHGMVQDTPTEAKPTSDWGTLILK